MRTSLSLPVLAIAGAGAIALAMRRRSPTDIAGEVAIVTGGSRGLGLLIARELGRLGCRVTICARDAAELEVARRDLEARGVATLAVPCDVADREDMERLVSATIARFGRVDILVSNAGIIRVGPERTMSHADFREGMAINFWGVVNGTLAALPHMRARRHGRIVNVTSIGGVVAVPHLLPYSAAKFAAVGFSEGLTAELATEGITVTTIVPGLMRTGSFLRALFDGRRRAEFAWFSLGATLPGISMDAERAARQIVSSMRRGETERVLSAPAILLARVHGLAPALVIRAAALVNRLLPSADGATAGAEEGWRVDRRLRSRAFRVVTALGRRAAGRFNEWPREARAS